MVFPSDISRTLPRVWGGRRGRRRPRHVRAMEANFRAYRTRNDFFCAGSLCIERGCEDAFLDLAFFSVRFISVLLDLNSEPLMNKYEMDSQDAQRRHQF